MPYSGEEIKDLTLYYIKRTISKTDQSKKSRILLNRDYDVVYGFTLKEIASDVIIKAFCTPYKLVPNIYKEFIDEVFADPLLSEDIKK